MDRRLEYKWNEKWGDKGRLKVDSNDVASALV